MYKYRNSGNEKKPSYFMVPTIFRKKNVLLPCEKFNNVFSFQTKSFELLMYFDSLGLSIGLSRPIR